MTLITEERKKIVLDFADTTLGSLALGSLVVCLIWILNYVLLRIAG